MDADLVRFLRERITTFTTDPTPGTERFMDAYREGLTAVLDDCLTTTSSHDGLADRTVRNLALLFQYDPGYRAEWRPTSSV